eukprot:scaffold29968_cov112-Isochrysis_galbana.AAC.7
MKSQKSRTDRSTVRPAPRRAMGGGEGGDAPSGMGACARCTGECAALRASLPRIEQDLSKLRRRVKLNVGGVRFETSAATLAKYDDSYFGALFSGRFELCTDEDGSIFLDRCARPTQHVRLPRPLSIPVPLSGLAPPPPDLRLIIPTLRVARLACCLAVPKPAGAVSVLPSAAYARPASPRLRMHASASGMPPQ